MRKSFVVLAVSILFAYPSNVGAQSNSSWLSGWVDQLSWFARQVTGTSAGSVHQCQDPLKSSDVEALKVLCAVEICGAPDENESARELESQLMASPAAEGIALDHMLEINEQLGRTLEAEEDFFKVFANSYHQAETQPLELTPEEAAVSDLISAIEFYPWAVIETSTTNSKSFSLNASATQKNIEAQLGGAGDLNRRQDLEGAVSSIQDLVAAPSFRQVDFLHQDVLVELTVDHVFALSLNESGSKATLKDHTIAHARELKRKAQELSKNHAAFAEFFNSRFLPLVNKAENGERLTVDESKNIAFASAAMEAYPAILKRREASGTTTKSWPKLNFMPALAKVLNKENELISIAKFNAEAGCAESLLRIGSRMPSTEQVLNAQQNVVQTKEKLKDFLSKRFSLQTSATLEKELDQFIFKYPMTSADFYKQIVVDLKNRESKLKASTLKLSTDKSPKESVRARLLHTLYQAQQLQSSGVQGENLKPVDLAQQTFAEVGEICERYEESFMADDVFVQGRLVRIGLYSVHNPAAGSGIIAHEMGHILHDILTRHEKTAAGTMSEASQNDYAKVTTCVANKHPDGAGQSLLKEDMADWFATSLDIEPINYACKFLGQASRPPQAGQLAQASGSLGSPAHYTDLEWIQADSTDPHSTDFFRAMAIHVQRGQPLPASCQRLVAAPVKQPCR